MEKSSTHINSVQTSLQALSNTPIDTSVILGSLGNYAFTLKLTAKIFLNKLTDSYDINNNNNTNNSSETTANANTLTFLTKEDVNAVNQLNDLLRLSLNNLQKLSSKTEMMDVILKKEKNLEILSKLEEQLFLFQQQHLSTVLTSSSVRHSISFASSALHANNKIMKSHPFMKRFTQEMDIQLMIQTCYEVKYYLQKYSKDDKYNEYHSVLTGLIDYLGNIRSKYLPKCAYWTFNGLQFATMKDLRYLFPDRILKHHSEGGGGGGEVINEHDRFINDSFKDSFRGIWHGHFLAIQKISSKRVFQNEEVGLRECLRLLENPTWKQSNYLLPLLGFSWDKEILYFLFPLSVNRSLYDLFVNASESNRVALTVEQKASILLDVVSGIQYLHACGIVHGRLKDTNILLDGTNHRAKLSDFGYQTYLTMESRIQNKGMHGIRWTPPEIIQLEHQYVEHFQRYNRNTMSNQDYQRFDNLLFKSSYYPSYPSTDIYAIGILVVVLLTEKIPFFNVESEEAVKGQLLNDQLPYILPQYPDEDVLSPLLDEIYQPCVGPIIQRPASDQLLKMTEQAYCNTIHRAYEKELQLNQQHVQTVKEEIHEIEQKIQEHIELIQKGREIIGRKETDKLKIIDSKLRRERDAEIQKAKMKLVGFQEELEGLKEDKEGAEHDLAQLELLTKDFESKLKEDKKLALTQRPEMLRADEEHVELETYCDSRDLAKLGALFSPKSSGMLPFTSEVSKSSPLGSLYDQHPDIAPADADQLIQRVSRGLFRYKHLADSVEIIFRVPVNFKVLLSNHSNAKKSASIYQEDISPMAAPVSISSNAVRASTQFPVRTVNAPGRDSALISSVSDDSSMPDFRAYRGRSNQGKDSDDDSDDEDAEALDETILQDSEYEVDDPYQNRDTQTRSQRFFSQAPNAYGNDLVKGILKGTGWEIPVSLPIVPKENTDPFPVDETDSLHVQFLAAARGDWDESVGLRRLMEGIPDEIIAAYLENDFTPIHLSAFLGNYKIFIEFIEQGGLNPNLPDNNGDTPLHCACKRGHFLIVQYLIEHCQSSLYASNANKILPIQYALKGGYLNIVRYMMEEAPKKILPHYVDEIFGATLLHWACLSQSNELVEYLIVKHNVSVESKTKEDQLTCLHWACYNSSLPVVRYLIEHAFANVQMKSAQGWSCLHFATASGSVEKASYLMDVVQLKLTDKDNYFKTAFDVAVGACAIFLQERKKKGFVTGSIAEKNRQSSNINEKGKEK